MCAPPLGAWQSSSRRLPQASWTLPCGCTAVGWRLWLRTATATRLHAASPTRSPLCHTHHLLPLPHRSGPHVHGAGARIAVPKRVLPGFPLVSVGACKDDSRLQFGAFAGKGLPSGLFGPLRLLSPQMVPKLNQACQNYVFGHMDPLFWPSEVAKLRVMCSLTREPLPPPLSNFRQANLEPYSATSASRKPASVAATSRAPAKSGKRAVPAGV